MKGWKLVGQQQTATKMETTKNKRPRKDRDSIAISVDGKKFVTSKSNLRSHCTYFASSLSEEWRNNHDDEDTATDQTIIHLDQDPEAFKILLNYFRYGFVNYRDLKSREVLMLIEFLGVESLLTEIKSKVIRHKYEEVHNEVFSTPDDENHEDEEDADCYCCRLFDEEYCSIVKAIKIGILPKLLASPSQHRRWLRPATQPKKEYAFMTISDEATLVPDIEGMMSDGAYDVAFVQSIDANILVHVFSCLQVQQPTQPSQNPNSLFTEVDDCHTYLEALNKLHQLGYTTLVEEYVDIPQAPQATFQGHSMRLCFSRDVVDEKDNAIERTKRESIIVYDDDEVKLNKRKQFVAVINTPDEVFIMAEHVQQQPHPTRRVLYGLHDLNGFYGRRSSRLTKITFNNNNANVEPNDSNLSSWLKQHNYSKLEKYVSQTFQKVYRHGLETESRRVNNAEQSRRVANITVKVYSRPLP